MKKLEELGISPAPWEVVPYGESTESNKPTVGDVVDATGESLVLDMPAYKDARLIAAAPKMYDRAQKLVSAFDRREMTPEHIEALRAALAEAAGEEVSMESKTYTSTEMRNAADLREAWGDKDEVNKMLRYAADVVERCEEVKHDLVRDISAMHGYTLNMDAKEFVEKLYYILCGDAGKEQ